MPYAIPGIALWNQMLCYSSLFCYVGRHAKIFFKLLLSDKIFFYCFACVENILLFNKWSKVSFQYLNPWSIMQYLTFVKENLFFNSTNMWILFLQLFHTSEAATEGVLLKKIFLKISQYSQKKTCAGVSF